MAFSTRLFFSSTVCIELQIPISHGAESPYSFNHISVSARMITINFHGLFRNPYSAFFIAQEALRPSLHRGSTEFQLRLVPWYMFCLVIIEQLDTAPVSCVPLDDRDCAKASLHRYDELYRFFPLPPLSGPYGEGLPHFSVPQQGTCPNNSRPSPNYERSYHMHGTTRESFR